MQKRCSCGKTMHMQIRSVIFADKVEIERVPIFTCESCNHSEIFAAVKDEIKQLIRRLGKHADNQQVNFSEINELAAIIVQASVQGNGISIMERLIEERVNQLLDMLILAKSLHESVWEEEIHHKLRQISMFSISTSI